MSGYTVLKQLLGAHEVKDNAKIRQFLKKYSKKGDIDINPGTTAWCAAAVNAAERAVGNPGTGKLNARSFSSYGNEVPLKEAQQGDIVVFSRGGSTWMGHVAYLDGVEKRAGKTLIRTLGGNQSDSVSIGWYPVERLITIRRYT